MLVLLTAVVHLTAVFADLSSDVGGDDCDCPVLSHCCPGNTCVAIGIECPPAADEVETQLEAPMAYCGPCNAQQCAMEQCPSFAPYMCTSGPAVKGCSPSPWPTSAACSGCCNVQQCGSGPTPTPPTPAPPSPSPGPSPKPISGVCGQASSDEERTKWPFGVTQDSWFSCASSAGRTNDLGNTPHMCQGDPASVRIAVRRGQAECLVAHASSCKIPMHDFTSLDYDFSIQGCMGIWAAPMWMTPDKWQWGAGSGEIDSTEMCPRSAMYLNFAGGGHQTRTGYSLNSAQGHITVRKDSRGIVTITACSEGEARSNGNQCRAPSYSSCSQCLSGGNSYGCWCNESSNPPNIYGSGGCMNGGDCMWTLVSDIWNGVRGDDGYNACMSNVPGVVGARQPNRNSDCAFSVQNIVLRGGGPGGALQWGPGSPSTCAYLTTSRYVHYYNGTNLAKASA